MYKKSTKEIAAAALGGACSGAIAAVGGGIIATGVGNAIEQVCTKGTNDFSVSDVVVSGVSAGAGGKFLGSKIDDAAKLAKNKIEKELVPVVQKKVSEAAKTGIEQAKKLYGEKYVRQNYKKVVVEANKGAKEMYGNVVRNAEEAVDVCSGLKKGVVEAAGDVLVWGSGKAKDFAQKTYEQTYSKENK